MIRRLILVVTIWYVAIISVGVPSQSSKAFSPAPTAEQIVLRQVGTDRGYGNLVGIQPFMVPTDYRSATSFLNKLDQYLAAARRKGWITPKTVILFPEMIGFYLFAVDEKEAVYQAPSLQDAASMLIAEHNISLPNNLDSHPAQETERYMRRKLLERKAARMAAVYQQTFGALARRYHATIVAGSILLPAPSVREGKLVCYISGPLYNVAAVFYANGRLAPHLTCKAFPTRDEYEQLGVTGVDVGDLPVFDTPVGKLGVAICADSWYPQTYQSLYRKGAHIMVTPSYGGGAQKDALWKGYSLGKGGKTPEDVILGDINKLTEAAAWKKYAMPGRMGATPLRTTNIPFGMTLFLRGHLWEEQAGNMPPCIMDRGHLREESLSCADTGVLSFWLPLPPTRTLR